MTNHHQRDGDSWIDQIEFGDGLSKAYDPDSVTIMHYKKKTPVILIAIALASKTSPESIMKIAKQLEPIKDKLMKK